MSWSIAVLLGMLAVGPSARAADNEDDAYSRWYFTAYEVEAAYQYQQNYGERLRAPLRAGECVFRNVEFSANYRDHRHHLPPDPVRPGPGPGRIGQQAAVRRARALQQPLP